MPFYKKLFKRIKKEIIPSEWKPKTRKEAAELAETAMMVMPVLKIGKVVKAIPKVAKGAYKVGKIVRYRVIPRALQEMEEWRAKLPEPTKQQIQAAKEARRTFDIIFTRGKETAEQVEKGLRKYFKGKW